MYDRYNKRIPLAPASDFPQLGFARTGYHHVFGNRQALLSIMANGIQDKSKLLMNKNLTRVTYSANGVTIKCKNGTTYNGDILVGADVIYSKTREALWSFAREEFPDEIEKDREVLVAEY